MKKAVQAYTGRTELRPQETSVIGAIAGGFTGIVTTPLDVLKTRLMVQGANGRYKNLFDATYQVRGCHTSFERMSVLMSVNQLLVMEIRGSALA